MSDPFAGLVDGVSAPATRALAVTPSDTTPLPNLPKALFIGGGGDLVARGMNDDRDTVFRGLAAGAILPFRASFVRATGTSATHIVALC
jgi:hypothetical protein